VDGAHVVVEFLAERPKGW